MNGRITNLDERIGRTLVFGIPGTRVREEDVRLFRETHAGGLILFKINIESRSQTRRLILDLERALGRRLLVSIDHEGGRVLMGGPELTVFPDNSAVGKAGNPRDAETQGRIEALELRRFGVDVNFSPVADVLTEGYSPNIGIRSYGRSPSRVGKMVAARVRGMQKNGMSACAKHFPGLGAAALDPHLDLPVISLSRKELFRSHLPPFENAIKAGVDLIMTSHPLYPRVDPRSGPATFSRFLATDLLRNELGFRGVLASDDLEMGALNKYGGPGPSAVRAVKAGHDLLLCCHRAEAQRRVFHSLRTAYRNGDLNTSDLERSVERIEGLRGWSAPRFPASAPALSGREKDLPRRLARGAVTVSGRLPPFRKGRVCVVFPRLSDPGRIIFVEKELHEEENFLKQRLKEGVERFCVETIPLNPAAPDIARALKAARASDHTLFFCYEAHMMPGCRILLDKLQNEISSLAVACLRAPDDQRLLRRGVASLTAFGYRRVQIEALLERAFRR